MSIDVTKERSLAQYTEGKRLAASSALYQLHCESWTRQWQESRIDVWSSDLLTTQTVYGCQYYLMSSLPSLSYYQSFAPGEFFGLSPESLAYGDMSEDDYLGHVFWDQETWMYSPFLLLQPQLAQSMLNTRLRVLNQARKNAVNNKVERRSVSMGTRRVRNPSVTI
ncbi:ATHL1 [Bugula neritina]|uniref:ATHL1 n=1 Tax=Bugula neritina TaxID=10212 RepID=A0A7J7K7P6_BUGNE|nr:ATHL1 [Bugula neritina]